MTKDKRNKGCPNEECERHIKKIKLKSTEEYCPKCGTKLIYVCTKCFTEIEDTNDKHKICSACEAEALEKKGIRKGKIKKVAAGAGKIGVVAVAPVAREIGKRIKRDSQNKAIELGVGAVKKVFRI